MRKLFMGAFAALFLCLGLNARNIKPNFSMKLYPEGQTVDKGIVENGRTITLGPCDDNGLRGDVEIVGDGNVGNINDPYIDIYLPKKCNGQMLVCCPGGGYKYCSSYNEGTRVAAWCLKQGIACCVVLYRMGRLNYFLGRLLVHIESFSLPNIILGEPFETELLQEAVEPGRIAEEVRCLLPGSPRREQVLAKLRAACDLLGPPGASGRVAEKILAAARDKE